MYRRDPGEILIQRVSFSFFLSKIEVSELIWACSAAHWGWAVSLAVARRTFRRPQFPHTGFNQLPCSAGLAHTPLPGCLPLPSQLPAGPALQQILKINIRIEQWQGTQWQGGNSTKLTRLNRHLWDPQRGRRKSQSCHTFHLCDPTQETLAGSVSSADHCVKGAQDLLWDAQTEL